MNKSERGEEKQEQYPYKSHLLKLYEKESIAKNSVQSLSIDF